MDETLLVLNGALVTQSVVQTALSATTGDVLIGYTGIDPANGISSIDYSGQPFAGEWVDLPHQEPANAWRLSVAPGFQQCCVLMRMGNTSEKGVLLNIQIAYVWEELSVYIGSARFGLGQYALPSQTTSGLVIEYATGNLVVKNDGGVVLLHLSEEQIDSLYSDPDPSGQPASFDYTALYPFGVTGSFQTIYDARGGHDAIRYFYSSRTPSEFWGNFILSKEVA